MCNVYDERLKHFGGGVVIDDGGAMKVVVWCGGVGGVVIGDGGAVRIWKKVTVGK